MCKISSLEEVVQLCFPENEKMQITHLKEKLQQKLKNPWKKILCLAEDLKEKIVM